METHTAYAHASGDRWRAAKLLLAAVLRLAGLMVALPGAEASGNASGTWLWETCHYKGTHTHFSVDWTARTYDNNGACSNIYLRSYVKRSGTWNYWFDSGTGSSVTRYFSDVTDHGNSGHRACETSSGTCQATYKTLS